MSFWNKLKGQVGAQFLDVIQWMEEDHDTLVYRYPVFNQAIQDGGKLVVREGQSAIFQAEGKISDSFTPGTYEISSRTKAIMGFFESIKYGLNYPYKGDIFFLNTRQVRDQKWGSPAPFPLRDKKFGLIKLRAFGTYSYRITDPVKFIREVVGNNGLFTTAEINGDIKNRLFDKFRNLSKEGGISYEELDMQSEEIGAALVQRLGTELENDYGIQLIRFTILNVSVDPKDEERIRRVEDIDVFDGRFDRYREMRQLDVMDTVANKQGGSGSNMMMDAGMGMAMGNMVGNMMGQQPQGQQQQQHQAPPPMNHNFHYHGPTGDGQFSAQDIAQKISANRSGTHNVWKQGFAAWKPALEVPEIANLIPPAPMAPPPMAGTVTYHYGEDGQNSGELLAGDIAKRVLANPSGKHVVWTQGFAAWKPAQEVPEIKAAMEAPSGPPPMGGAGGPPPM